MPILKCSFTPEAVNRIHDLLQCLFKFGETVGIEARPDKLTFTSLNISKTAYAAFALKPSTVCISYEFPCDNEDRSSFTCQLYNRTLLSAFKSRNGDTRHADTPVEKCDFYIEDEELGKECRLVITVVCRYGLSKIFRLTYESVEIMHALFDKRAAGYDWQISAKVMKEYIEFFGTKTEQLDMLNGGQGKAIFTSFTEKIVDGKEILKQPLETSVSIHTDEFESFNFDPNVHVVISVKDFRAIVHHADSLRTSLTARFSGPNKPLQFSYHYLGIHAEFTLMTSGDYRDANSSSRTVKVPTAPLTSSRQTSAAPSQRSTIPPLSQQLQGTQSSSHNQSQFVNDDSMPPPARPLAIASQIQKRPLAALKKGARFNKDQGQLQNESLFVPADDDGEDDRRWEPHDYDNDDGGEMLGWDTSGEVRSGQREIVRDGGSHAPSARSSKAPSRQESQELAATQRLADLKAMFD